MKTNAPFVLTKLFTYLLNIYHALGIYKVPGSWWQPNCYAPSFRMIFFPLQFLIVLMRKTLHKINCSHLKHTMRWILPMCVLKEPQSQYWHRTFILPRSFLVPLCNSSLPLPWPRATIDLYFDTVNYSVSSRIFYKWNHTIYTVSCLASFFQHNDFWISSKLLYMSVVHSYLLLGDILLYGYNTVCLSIPLLRDIWLIYRFCYYR